MPHPPYYSATPTIIRCHTHPTTVPHPPLLPGDQTGTSAGSLRTSSSEPPPRGRYPALTCPGSESQPGRGGREGKWGQGHLTSHLKLHQIHLCLELFTGPGAQGLMELCHEQVHAGAGVLHTAQQERVTHEVVSSSGHLRTQLITG